MSSRIIHYLFGEIGITNQSKIFPSDERKLKACLDRWLPSLMCSAEETEQTHDKVEKLCDLWSKHDTSNNEMLYHLSRDEVGLISMPLPAENEDYAHLVCRTYYRWASGGRVSRSAHVMILSAEMWKEIDYNPFALPFTITNSYQFKEDYNLNFPQNFSQLTWKKNNQFLENIDQHVHHSFLPCISPTSPPLLLPSDTPETLFELIIRSLAPSERQKFKLWSGPFFVRNQYKQYFHLGRASEPLSSFDTKEELSPFATYLKNSILNKNIKNEVSWNQHINSVPDIWSDEFPKIRIDPENKQSIPNLEIKEDFPHTEEPTKSSNKKNEFSLKKRVNIIVLVLCLFIGGLGSIYFVIPYFQQKTILQNFEVNADEWFKQVKKKNQPGYDIALLLQSANNLLGTAPDQYDKSKLKKKIHFLLKNFLSNLASVESSSDIMKVHSQLEKIYLVSQLNNFNDFSEMKRITGFNQQIHNRETVILGEMREKNISQSRQMLNQLKMLYAKNSQLPVNESLNEIEQTIRRAESGQAYDALFKKWYRKKLSTQNIRKFTNDISLYKRSFSDLWERTGINRLELEKYQDFEKYYRKALNNAYEEFKKNPYIEANNMLVNAYSKKYLSEVNAIPNNLKIKATDSFIRDIWEKELLQIKLNYIPETLAEKITLEFGSVSENKRNEITCSPEYLPLPIKFLKILDTKKHCIIITKKQSFGKTQKKAKFFTVQDIILMKNIKQILTPEIQWPIIK